MHPELERRLRENGLDDEDIAILDAASLAWEERVREVADGARPEQA